MNARLSDYHYDLPRELIAQRPLERREDSRMMVLRRDRQTIEHRQFPELKALLSPRDLLVLNDTRVIPARRFSNDGTIEFLFIARICHGDWNISAGAIGESRRTSDACRELSHFSPGSKQD